MCRMLNHFMNVFVSVFMRICVCLTGLESQVWMKCCVQLCSFVLLEKVVVHRCKLENY
jgi:hypothetical protein